VWRARAEGWSEGADLEVDGVSLRLPLRARVELSDGAVVLPDGRKGRVARGRVQSFGAVLAEARAGGAAQRAAATFAGTPYLWGGVTPWGADCSGLVQTTFAALGLSLPRDSYRQATVGEAIDPAGIRPDDLLFFAEDGTRITHVAIAGAGDTLTHATIACGGFVREPWGPGTRAGPLRERLVAVRRIAYPID
jgi:cell wall-associated NlpC family hydrolase